MKLMEIASVITVSLLATEPVLAATAPRLCLESTRAKASYNTGVLLGHSLVQRVWQAVADCDQLDTFASIVRKNIKSYVVGGTEPWAICRYAGTVDGAYEELDAVWMTCNADCCSVGELIGNLGADFYCSLSQLLGGLTAPDEIAPRPVNTCDAFSDCCITTFRNTSRGECAEYTDGAYGAVWLESAAVQCTEQ